MIRLVLGDDDALWVDLVGRAFGRGAWVHARPECLARAASGGAAKSFKARVATDPAALIQAVRETADRRVEALLSSGNGARRLVPGSDAAAAAYEQCGASCVIVAADAKAAAQSDWIEQAGAAGHVVVWGTKERLGRVMGRSDTAVVAVTDRGLGSAIAQAVALSCMPEPTARQTGRAQALVEVR